MRIFAGFFIVLLLQFSASAVFADKIDDVIIEKMAAENIPGAAVAVIKGGKVIRAKPYGMASVEFGVKTSTESVFEIGSVSKQMTAAAIMLLVQDGKLSLDDKISKHLANTPSEWENVTIRHLLNHTSGIKSYSSLSGFELSRRVKVDGFIRQLTTEPMDFATGTEYKYNNSGYNLAAYVIESVSGRPFIEFMRERIFEPLKMTKTSDRDPQNIIKGRVTGYESRLGKLSGRDGSLTDLMGAGSIVSTITDMTKWALALRNDSLLKPESKQEMWKAGVFSGGETFTYGLGFRLYETRGYKFVGHTGQTAGFGAAIFFYEPADLIVIALVNQGDLGLGGQIATLTAKQFISELSLRSIKPSDDFINAVVKKKVDDAFRSRFSGELSEALFSEKLIKSLSSERAKFEDKRIADLGKRQNIKFVGLEYADNRPVYRFLANHGKSLILWKFSFDDTDKIAEMSPEEEE